MSEWNAHERKPQVSMNINIRHRVINLLNRIIEFTRRSCLKGISIYYKNAVALKSERVYRVGMVTWKEDERVWGESGQTNEWIPDCLTEKILESSVLKKTRKSLKKIRWGLWKSHVRKSQHFVTSNISNFYSHSHWYLSYQKNTHFLPVKLTTFRT